MLSAREKDQLYLIIAATLGDDHTVKSYKSGFSEETVTVVEDMIAANRTCNARMRELITELVGAAALGARGWLRRFLKASSKQISKAELEGYGCLVSVKARWKSAIIASTL